MSNKDRLNWSADLRRIAWWLQIGKISLADKFIERGEKLYAKGGTVANRSWKWWMGQLRLKDKKKAAERALTLSLLLRQA